MERRLVKQEAGERIANDICSAIRNGQLKPGDKLQGEAELARIYAGSVYNVRKALARLKHDNVLYSVPKVGVFIAEHSPCSPAVRRNMEPALPETDGNSIRFLTSENPYLSDAWKSVTESFHERLPFASVKMEFGSDPDRKNPPDIWECSSPLHKYQFNDMDAFDFSEIHQDSLIQLTPNVVPFINSLDLLFYHPSLLERLKMPPPSWKTFEEQTDYLDRVISAAAAHPEYEIPGTIQQPLMRMDHYYYQVFADIRKSHFIRQEQFIAKHEPAFRKVTELWKKFKISPSKQAEKNVRNFLDKKTPFFFGDSYYYGRIIPYSDFECYPILSIEDRLQTHSDALLLSARSEHLVEAIRFLHHLQSPEVQLRFAAKGKFPLRRAEDTALPFRHGRDLFATAHDTSFFFHSQAEQYIGMNIINVELWDCILFGKSVPEALSNSLNLSKLYLKMKLDKAVRAKQENQAEIYS